MSVQIMENVSFVSKPRDWKSGSSQIQNYWLKHSQLTKGILQKIYQPITCLRLMYKTISRIATGITTNMEEQNLLPAEQKDVTLEVNVTRIN